MGYNAWLLSTVTDEDQNSSENRKDERQNDESNRSATLVLGLTQNAAKLHSCGGSNTSTGR